MFRRFSSAIITLAVLLVVIPHSPAQELAHRLILKDGSYQLVTKYEIKGDRVHYYSAERDEWEDLPTSLVDWPATEKFEKDRSAAVSAPEAAEVDKEMKSEADTETEAPLPQVAPGLRIPEETGVFLLDNFKGEPQLVEMQQSEGDVSESKKGNILRAAVNPVAGVKQSIELEGEHAKIQSHVAVPSIYLNVEDSPDASPWENQQKPGDNNPNAGKPQTQQAQQPQQAEKAVVPFDRYRIVRVETKNGKRIVGDVKRGVTGKITSDQKYVKTTIDRVTGGWLKLTPSEDMAPGEYVVVEMMGAEGMNLEMWDFGVNPNAAANANPWKPEVKAPEVQK